MRCGGRPRPIRLHRGISSLTIIAIGSSPVWRFQYRPPPSTATRAIGARAFPFVRAASARERSTSPLEWSPPKPCSETTSGSVLPGPCPGGYAIAYPTVRFRATRPDREGPAGASVSAGIETEHVPSISSSVCLPGSTPCSRSSNPVKAAPMNPPTPHARTRRRVHLRGLADAWPAAVGTVPLSLSPVDSPLPCEQPERAQAFRRLGSYVCVSRLSGSSSVRSACAQRLGRQGSRPRPSRPRRRCRSRRRGTGHAVRGRRK